MNLTEITIYLLAMGLLAGYVTLQFREEDRFTRLALIALPIPFIYLALESATVFFTTDAGFGFFGEIYDLAASNMVQYRFGGFRTTEMLLAPITPVIRYFIESSYDVAMVLKGVHWLLGFMFVLWIHAASQTLIVGGKTAYFCIFIVTALLLPTNMLALKIFNYDKLALFIGILGIIYVIRALSEQALSEQDSGKAKWLALAGLAALVFAAQEKLIATPFMWLAMPVAAHFYAQDKAQRNPGNIAYQYLTGSFAVLFLVVFINALCYLELGLIRGTFNAMAPADILRPLERIIWPLLQKSLQMTFYEAILLLVLSLSVTFLGSVILRKVLVSSLARRFSEKYLMPGLWCFYILALVMFALTVIWSFQGQVYLGPFQPVAEGHFMPRVSFNSGYWHFGATTYSGHILRLLLTDIAIFVTALPTAVWLAAGLTFLLESGIGSKIGLGNAGIKNSFTHQPGGLPLLLMAFLMLTIPILFALTQTPAGARYFNLFLFGFVIFLLIRFSTFLVEKKIRILSLAILLPMLLIEVAAYRPLYGAFVPFWYAQIERPENRNIEAGVLGPINRWWGWGEEVMLAGRLIADQCEPQHCANIRLHTSYAGIWLNPVYNSMGWVSVYTQEGTRIAYTENDYFIVTRASILQKTTPFPGQVPVFDTIKYGDYVQAYIFRGDVLSEYGFTF